ncbi:hypothetical protein PR048_022973 [Dryococelus australis]|uniref:BCD1 alpha/beta domain-containing protein n=1 Tax=Dryococelus australis TaxID=614101 RepID=A0ABQ9GST9_9NEOP|nr:hypothetical protein PR048_022973 [Dryococelus australis]
MVVSLAEDMRLAAVVSKYLDPTKCDEVLREHFQYYHSQGLAGVVLLLKTEFPARFFKLDPSNSLKANLCGKYIIEFPTVYVVLKDHQHVYNIVDSGGRTKEKGGKREGKKGDHKVERRIRRKLAHSSCAILPAKQSYAPALFTSVHSITNSTGKQMIHSSSHEKRTQPYYQGHQNVRAATTLGNATSWAGTSGGLQCRHHQVNEEQLQEPA